MALNSLGTEKKVPIAAPVSLPKFDLADIDIEIEAKEAAARVAEKKVIRRGRDCWEAIGQAESYENWRTIALALRLGRDHALRVSGANAPNGRRYTVALSDWLNRNFASTKPMPKQTRYWCLQLNDHLPAIEQWRTTLPERQRRKLINPVSVVRHWQRATGQLKSRCTDDMQRAAMIAWRRFVACVEALPPDQAAPVWRHAQAQANATMTLTRK
jgi:hypothetical protein